MVGKQQRDIHKAFSRDTLRRVCEMREETFARVYDMETVTVPQRAPEDFYHFLDRGSKVLAVAHLDTVAWRGERRCTFSETEAGTVVHSRALDDRLGAYIILDMLPKLGVNVDVLLTVGEESGQSTGLYFDAPKDYNWMIEFDRGGSDVVMYQYDDDATRSLVRASGARVGDGIFSDISYMEHLGIKGFNWGVGYQDYHGPRSHAYLEDTFEMLGYFLNLFEAMEDHHLPHEETPYGMYGGRGGSYRSYGSRSWLDSLEGAWDDSFDAADHEPPLVLGRHDDDEEPEPEPDPYLEGCEDVNDYVLKQIMAP